MLVEASINRSIDFSYFPPPFFSLFFRADDCTKEDGTRCLNGVCLGSVCHCNDGFGGCNCQVPGERNFLFFFKSTCIYTYNVEKKNRLLFSSLKSRTLRFHSSYYDFGMLRECKHAFQTRTSANTGPAIYSRIAPTLLVASNVPVSPATKATVSIAKVRVSFFLSRSFTTSGQLYPFTGCFYSFLFCSRLGRHQRVR